LGVAENLGKRTPLRNPKLYFFRVCPFGCGSSTPCVMSQKIN
jgi:hypothetical protein